MNTKTAFSGLILGGFLASQLVAQQLTPLGGPRGGGGPPGFGDPARRTEMLADRLAEDLGLSRDQRKEVKEILDQTQTAAKPLQDALQTARKSLKEAIRAGKPAADLDPLHQQIGVAAAKLAALQSTAFAESLKLLKEDQKDNADMLYELLGMITSASAKPTMRGGPGGPDGFREPGGRSPRGPGGPHPE